MNKTLTKIRNTTFGIFMAEAVIIVTAAILYFFTKFWEEVVIVPDILLYYLLVIVLFIVIDALYFYFAAIYLKKVREKNDLDAAVLIGADMDDAYNFGKIGMIVVDETNTIIWTNSLFKNLNIDIIDHDVFEWQPDLKELVNAPVNTTVHTTISYKNYEVKYLSEPRLFILKDESKILEVENEREQQSMVMGIINIDNFDDFSNDTDDSAAAVNVIRNIIFDYAKAFNAVLRRVKNDTYFVVCNHSSLKKMTDDGFSLLKKAREAGREENTPLTLSIGFAHGFPEAGKLNDAANMALQSALARGGDQCVVSEFGNDLQYYGGKTIGIESQSKVKMRSRADSLINNIRTSSNIIIMGHDKMDMDALGSCLGVKAICDWCANKDAKIVYNPKQVESKTREAFNNSFSKEQAQEIIVSPDEALGLIKESTLLIVCDIRVPLGTMAPKLLDRASKIILIDHHRLGNSVISDNVILDVSETSASSASELVAEMIRFATANPRITIPQTYATIMLSGIFLDTTFFKSKTSMMTFEACETLKGFNADNSLASEFLKDELQEYQLINEMVSKVRFPYPGIATAINATDLVEKETLAKVANRIMDLKGINACFVFGKTAPNACGCSARSDGTINVQLICEKCGGGGHFNASAIAFKDLSDPAKANAEVVSVLNNYLEQARGEMAEEEGA